MDKNNAIGSNLTFTLEWVENVDLDLHIICQHGKECYYGNMKPCNEGCGINLDIDMRGYHHRKPGEKKMIENIYIVKPEHGHTYRGS